MLHFTNLFSFSLKFVGTDFVASSFDLALVAMVFDHLSSIISSSHVITELSVILAKYFPFLQLHVEGFQI